MSTFLTVASLFLLLNFLAGLARVYRGPGAADRLLATLLFATTTVAAVLLLAYASAHPGLVKVALVFVLLGAVAVVAFVRLPPPDRPGTGH